MIKEVREMHELMTLVFREAIFEEKEAAEFSTHEIAVLPQIFYDNVCKYRANPNPYDSKPGT